MSVKTFFSKVGQQFSIGWKNGNLAKGLKATGMAMTGIGLTGAAFHDIKNSCCSVFDGYFPSSYMNPSYSGFNTYLSSSYMNPMYNPMGYGYNDLYSSYNNQYGLDMAYQQGYYDMEQAMKELELSRQQEQQALLQQHQQILDAMSPGYDNTAAKMNDASITGDAAETFDTNLKSISDGESKEFTLLENVTTETYTTEISKLGKSYIKDKDTNSDGFVALTEYKNSCDANEQEIAEYIFVKMDLNRDDKLDWKEMSAVFTTYDAGGKTDTTLDGKVKKDEYKSVTNKFAGKDDSLTKTIQNWYKTLFKPAK